MPEILPLFYLVKVISTMKKVLNSRRGWFSIYSSGIIFRFFVRKGEARSH